MTIDFNNQLYDITGTNFGFSVTNGAKVTMKNSQLDASKRIAAVSNNATLIIESGTYKSGDCAFQANDNGHLIVNGGDITAQEFGVLVLDKGSTIEINDGVFTSIDNAVIGGNGSPGKGGTTMTVNGGTFNGNITSNGYIACGIYHPQDGTLIINGGTFNVKNGVGILIRSGNVTINDVSVTTIGNVQGKVGDSKVLTECSAIYIDGTSKYPGWNNCYTTVKGGTFNTDNDVQVVTVTVPEGEDKADRLKIEGGIFNGDTDISF